MIFMCSDTSTLLNFEIFLPPPRLVCVCVCRNFDKWNKKYAQKLLGEKHRGASVADVLLLVLQLLIVNFC